MSADDEEAEKDAEGDEEEEDEIDPLIKAKLLPMAMFPSVHLRGTQMRGLRCWFGGGNRSGDRIPIVQATFESVKL